MSLGGKFVKSIFSRQERQYPPTYGGRWTSIGGGYPFGPDYGGNGGSWTDYGGNGGSWTDYGGSDSGHRGGNNGYYGRRRTGYGGRPTMVPMVKDRGATSTGNMNKHDYN